MARELVCMHASCFSRLATASYLAPSAELKQA